MRRSVLVLITLLSAACLFPADAWTQQNPFMTPSGSAKPARTVQDPLRNTGFMSEVRAKQKVLQDSISGYIRQIKDNPESGLLGTFLLMSFAYGFLHALGPGHRKMVLFSYFIAKPSDWKKGMAAGFLTAVLHAASAIGLVTGLYLLTTKAILRRFNDLGAGIELISYSVILAMGIFLLASNTVMFARKKDAHDAGKASGKGVLLMIIASGMVPCPGAAAILIFSVAAGALKYGVLSALAMSAGMGTLLALIPPAAILLQDRLTPLLRKASPEAGRIAHFALSSAGAVLLILTGLLFLI